PSTSHHHYLPVLPRALVLHLLLARIAIGWLVTGGLRHGALPSQTQDGNHPSIHRPPIHCCSVRFQVRHVISSATPLPLSSSPGYTPSAHSR
ncbi:hypothetical protein C8R44DRAFT_824961, partial [Mycena epipterygia]